MIPIGKHCLTFDFYFSLRLTHIEHTYSRGPKKIIHVFTDSLEQEGEKKGKEKGGGDHAHKAFLVPVIFLRQILH